MNEYAAFEFATPAIRVLLIILAVALLSYAMKSRLMFFAGLSGSFLGYVMPKLYTLRVSGTLDGIVRTHVEYRTAHIVRFGTIGAIVACGIVAAIHFRRNPQSRYSAGGILLVMAAIAIMIWACQLEVWWPKD